MVLVAAVLLFASAGWGLYTEHYCLHLPQRPVDATTIVGPRFLNPITLECSYGELGSVAVRDVRPLSFNAAMFGVSLLVAAHMWYQALRRRGSSR